MTGSESLSSLSNPLATLDQLSTSSSTLDGVPSELESSIRLAGLQLTQAAGILLRLPQEIVAQAMVVFTRFYLGAEGGSFRFNSAKDVSAASIYMTAKLSAEPQLPRSICNVYAYLLSDNRRQSFDKLPVCDPESYYLSEGTYHSARAILLQTETILLRALSFDVKIVTPHHLAMTYLQTLGVFQSAPSSKSPPVAFRTLALLNLALFSPQLLYVTNQPTALAVAAIYLASREVGVKLADNEWWEVFDVEREDLGFLVVAMRSCEAWIRAEKERWLDRPCPLDIDRLEVELKRRSQYTERAVSGRMETSQ
ncbi:MAG: hypothetical protein Q9218_005577 [Villophora microphyllina]